jgi:hypothetical protein
MSVLEGFVVVNYSKAEAETEVRVLEGNFQFLNAAI